MSTVAALLTVLLCGGWKSTEAQGGFASYGKWTAQAPEGGCASMPLIKVSGPDTLLAPGNASSLEAFTQQINMAMAKACPGTHEAILALGRTRHLVELPGSNTRVAAATPDATGPARPVTAVTSPVAAPSPAAQPAPEPSPVVTLTTGQSSPTAQAAIPAIPTPVSLRSLNSVGGAQEKCDVLLDWLNWGKANSTGRGRNAYALPDSMREIFRDELMQAVFGRTYDAFDNSARIDLYQKSFDPCVAAGRAIPRRSSDSIIDLRGFRKPIPPQYATEFAPYREMLAEAFQGRSGAFDTVSLTRYVTTVRTQVVSANEAMRLAATGPATLPTFEQIQVSRDRLRTQAPDLRPAERTEISNFLGQRQDAMAPAIVQAWLAEVAAKPNTIGGAQDNAQLRREMQHVLEHLDATGKDGANARYGQIVSVELRPAIEVETVKLSAFPATLDGAIAFSGWESTFHQEFRGFESSPAFADAMKQVDEQRTRVYGGALAAWKQKVKSMGSSAAQIDARRTEIVQLFPDKQTPMYAAFLEPVDQSEAQRKAREDSEEKQRLAIAENAMATQAVGGSESPAIAPASRSRSTPPAVAHPASRAATDKGGVSTAQSLVIPQGPGADALLAIYTGEFQAVEFDRNSLDFKGMVSGYEHAFWQECRDYLPARRRELTRTQCDSALVNGYGVVVNSCATSHQEGTGVFVDAELDSAANSADMMQQMSTAMSSITSALTATSFSDMISRMAGPAVHSANVEETAGGTVASNACDGAPMQHLLLNLKRFGRGDQGMLLNGTTAMGVAVLPAPPGGTYRDSNYDRLLNDLVQESSQSWAFNKFRSGSVGGATIDQRDSGGRPARVSAGYIYDGLQGHSSSKVTLTFVEGVPKCMYFADAPDSCRVPSNRLTYAYINGKYR